MKKFFSLASICLVFIVISIGCSNAAGGGAPSSPAPAPVTTITVEQLKFVDESGVDLTPAVLTSLLALEGTDSLTDAIIKSGLMTEEELTTWSELLTKTPTLFASEKTISSTVLQTLKNDIFAIDTIGSYFFEIKDDDSTKNGYVISVEQGVTLKNINVAFYINNELEHSASTMDDVRSILDSLVRTHFPSGYTWKNSSGSESDRYELTKTTVRQQAIDDLNKAIKAITVVGGTDWHSFTMDQDATPNADSYTITIAQPKKIPDIATTNLPTHKSPSAGNETASMASFAIQEDFATVSSVSVGFNSLWLKNAQERAIKNALIVAIGSREGLEELNIADISYTLHSDSAASAIITFRAEEGYVFHSDAIQAGESRTSVKLTVHFTGSFNTEAEAPTEIDLPDLEFSGNTGDNTVEQKKAEISAFNLIDLEDKTVTASFHLDDNKIEEKFSAVYSTLSGLLSDLEDIAGLNINDVDFNVVNASVNGQADVTLVLSALSGYAFPEEVQIDSDGKVRVTLHLRGNFLDEHEPIIVPSIVLEGLSPSLDTSNALYSGGSGDFTTSDGRRALEIVNDEHPILGSALKNIFLLDDAGTNFKKISGSNGSPSYYAIQISNQKISRLDYEALVAAAIDMDPFTTSVDSATYVLRMEEFTAEKTDDFYNGIGFSGYQQPTPVTLEVVEVINPIEMTLAAVATSPTILGNTPESYNPGTAGFDEFIIPANFGNVRNLAVEFDATTNSHDEKEFAILEALFDSLEHTDSTIADGFDIAEDKWGPLYELDFTRPIEAGQANLVVSLYPQPGYMFPESVSVNKEGLVELTIGLTGNFIDEGEPITIQNIVLQSFIPNFNTDSNIQNYFIPAVNNEEWLAIIGDAFGLANAEFTKKDGKYSLAINTTITRLEYEDFYNQFFYNAIEIYANGTDYVLFSSPVADSVLAGDVAIEVLEIIDSAAIQTTVISAEQGTAGLASFTIPANFGDVGTVAVSFDANDNSHIEKTSALFNSFMKLLAEDSAIPQGFGVATDKGGNPVVDLHITNASANGRATLTVSLAPLPGYVFAPGVPIDEKTFTTEVKIGFTGNFINEGEPIEIQNIVLRSYMANFETSSNINNIVSSLHSHALLSQLETLFGNDNLEFTRTGNNPYAIAVNTSLTRLAYQDFYNTAFGNSVRLSANGINYELDSVSAPNEYLVSDIIIELQEIINTAPIITDDVTADEGTAGMNAFTIPANFGNVSGIAVTFNDKDRTQEQKKGAILKAIGDALAFDENGVSSKLPAGIEISEDSVVTIVNTSSAKITLTATLASGYTLPQGVDTTIELYFTGDFRERISEGFTLNPVTESGTQAGITAISVNENFEDVSAFLTFPSSVPLTVTKDVAIKNALTAAFATVNGLPDYLSASTSLETITPSQNGSLVATITLQSSGGKIFPTSAIESGESDTSIKLKVTLNGDLRTAVIIPTSGTVVASSTSTTTNASSTSFTLNSNFTVTGTPTFEFANVTAQRTRAEQANAIANALKTNIEKALSGVTAEAAVDITSTSNARATVNLNVESGYVFADGSTTEKTLSFDVSGQFNALAGYQNPYGQTNAFVSNINTKPTVSFNVRNFNGNRDAQEEQIARDIATGLSFVNARASDIVIEITDNGSTQSTTGSATIEANMGYEFEDGSVSKNITFTDSDAKYKEIYAGEDMTIPANNVDGFYATGIGYYSLNVHSGTVHTKNGGSIQVSWPLSKTVTGELIEIPDNKFIQEELIKLNLANTSENNVFDATLGSLNNNKGVDVLSLSGIKIKTAESLVISVFNSENGGIIEDEIYNNVPYIFSYEDISDYTVISDTSATIHARIQLADGYEFSGGEQEKKLPITLTIEYGGTFSSNEDMSAVKFVDEFWLTSNGSTPLSGDKLQLAKDIINMTGYELTYEGHKATFSTTKVYVLDTWNEEVLSFEMFGFTIADPVEDANGIWVSKVTVGDIQVTEVDEIKLTGNQDTIDDFVSLLIMEGSLFHGMFMHEENTLIVPSGFMLGGLWDMMAIKVENDSGHPEMSGYGATITGPTQENGKTVYTFNFPAMTP